MPILPPNPIVYEINTAIWLRELRACHGDGVTLASVPAAVWDAVAATGVHAVWLMGVWERSPVGLQVALADERLREDFVRALPDVTERDIQGSPYCVRRYRVDATLGGDDGLAHARVALAARGLGLVLDFVPNHVARDHPWVTEHPDWFVQGTASDLAGSPEGYFESEGRVIACGRDPYFPPWSDVAQVNAYAPGLRAAYVDALCALAERCDAVRCDMAMLLMNDVFARTWGARAGTPPADEFWPTVIGAVHATAPAFRLIAEAYWDLEWDLLQQGFDFCYDKRLYDRLRGETASSVAAHLEADLTYQAHLVRFIENHDEPRAAEAFGADRSRAAAALILSLPGAKLLYEGQFEGRHVRPPVFLTRRPSEPADAGLLRFYGAVVADAGSTVFREGRWERPPRRGWPDNETCQSLLVNAWRQEEERRLIVMNDSTSAAQARIELPWADLRGRRWRLTDLVSGQVYERDGDALAGEGLFVDLPAWGVHWFRMGSG